MGIKEWTHNLADIKGWKVADTVVVREGFGYRPELRSIFSNSVF